MLLPSALPCDLRLPPARLFSPPFSPAPASHLGAPILSSCRALQSLLGSQPPAQTSAKPMSSAKRNLAPSPQIGHLRKAPQATRGAHKRSRSTFETDRHDTDNDQENIQRDDMYLTPKRARLVPPTLPLGLKQQDFEALEPLSRSAKSEDLGIESKRKGTEASDEWNTEDDKILVDMVLEKLRLSRQDWEDCARILGKEKASIGRRWELLLGDGKIGLRIRRGAKKERSSLDGVWN